MRDILTKSYDTIMYYVQINSSNKYFNINTVDIWVQF